MSAPSTPGTPIAATDSSPEPDAPVLSPGDPPALLESPGLPHADPPNAPEQKPPGVSVPEATASPVAGPSRVHLSQRPPSPVAGPSRAYIPQRPPSPAAGPPRFYILNRPISPVAGPSRLYGPQKPPSPVPGTAEWIYAFARIPGTTASPSSDSTTPPPEDGQTGDQHIDKKRRESLKSVMARKKKEMLEAGQGAGELVTTSLLYDPYANSTASNYITRGKTGVIWDKDCLQHRCEWDVNHPENPQRLTTIFARCEGLDLFKKCVQLDNTVRGDLIERLTRFHTRDQYEKLRLMAGTTNLTALEEECAKYDSIFVNFFTFDSALRSLSAVINLVESVAKRDVMNGMALVRPPGHHALEDEFNGYCFFNNVAIAAEAVIQDGLAKKILIVDIDVHHGQATQRMFYDRDDVLYFSIHRYEHGAFWPYLLESNFHYIGQGKGLGYNINVPLNSTDLTDEDYLAIVFSILLPVGYEFNPDLVIMSAGYDAAIGCPEGRMKVSPSFYSHLTSFLHTLARGQLAVVLEGGYCLPSLAESASLTLKTLLGGPCPMMDPFRCVHPSVIESITNVKRVLYGRWKCFNLCEIDDQLSYRICFVGEPDQPPFMTRQCYPANTEEEDLYYHKLIAALREKYRAPINLPVGLIYDDLLLLHSPQSGDVERPERPERLTSIMRTFQEFGLTDRLLHLPIVKRDFEEYNPHDPDYVESIAVGLQQARDLYVNSHTMNTCKLAVSGLLTLFDELMGGNIRSGIALIRPPGHHAERKKAGGFCFFNNVAVGAKYLLERYCFRRILIVDFDVHHGNGTQDIFYEEHRVMYISIHKDEKGRFFPAGSHRGYKFDGIGPGEGFNMNIPFNKDRMGDTEYLAVFHNVILPAAYAFGPQVVIVSAGFDAGVHDPLGGYLVNPETFGHMIMLLKPLAEGRIFLTLEGGYNLTTTSYAMAICAKALLGDPVIMPRDLYQSFSEEAMKTIRNVTRHFRQYFNIFSAFRRLPGTGVIVRRVRDFTSDMYGRELYRTLDPKQVHDNEYVEREMEELNMSINEAAP